MLKVEVLAKTYEEGGELTHLKVLGGKLAGICYMADDYCSDAIQNVDNAIKRANMTAKSGHHSVFDHGNITLLLQGIPKMVAMLLNSTEFYTTSEKSARYTKMDSITGYEQFFYDKWAKIFVEKIKATYSNIDDTMATKLAQENARYMTSVFTPTTMAYTTSYRQLNYLVDWCDRLVASLQNLDGGFNKKLMGHVTDLRNAIMGTLGTKTLTDIKGRYFEFLPLQHGLNVDGHQDILGDVYSTDYRMSFAALAQAQRHRTLHYQMIFRGHNSGECGFYVPKIIRAEPNLANEWLKDISSLAEYHPQGTMVRVIEQGLFKNFALKCKERLCGRAQLEIMENTVETLELFQKDNVWLSTTNQILLDSMTHNGTVPRCGFKGYKCVESCIWGPEGGLTRKI